MGKSSRTKRRASVKSARRSRGNLGWWVLSGVIIVGAVALIFVSRDAPAAPLANKDHWHAAIGVNVCGNWMANPPEFHNTAANPAQQAGIHSHGDGLIHIHPYVTSESGKHATVGKFLEYGGWKANSTSFELWDNAEHATGDKCDGKEATVRWEVNGKAKSGNISDYRPDNGDVIALALLPKGQEIGTPPSASELAAPSDLQPGGGTQAPGVTDTTAVPAPGDTSATTAPGDTTPTTTTGETPASSTP
jgi:hypothetical protein